MKRSVLLLLPLLILAACNRPSAQPEAIYDRSDFVEITDVVPDAILEIRYYSTYNFVGARVDGYERPIALITREKNIPLGMGSTGMRRNGNSSYIPS